MADLSLGGVEKIIKIGLAIKKAAATARRNKEECGDIERCVGRVGALLAQLNGATELVRHPAMSGPLEDLAESLEKALELITECQESNAVRRFLAAEDMATQLRRVQDDILRKLELGNFANTVQINITLTNAIRWIGGALPLLTQLPETSNGSSGTNSEITTMPATENKVPYALSGLIDSTSSELDVSGGGHSYGLKVHGKMADHTLEIANDIVKTGIAIKEALDTIRQNAECQGLQELVAIAIAILSRTEVDLRTHPAMCSVLVSLNRSLDCALKLVTELQKRNGLHRFFTARDMAKKLRRVHDDVQLKMQVMNFAIVVSTMEVTINLTKTTIFQYDGAHPLPTRPQEAVELEMYSSHSNTGLTKFGLSKTVTTHQVSEENVNGGSSYTVVSKRPRNTTSRPAPLPLLIEEHTDTPAQASSMIVSATHQDQEHARASPLLTMAEDLSATPQLLQLPAPASPRQLAVAAEDTFAAQDPLLLQHRAAVAAAPARRTFNMSRVRRRARLPAARRQLSRMMQRARSEEAPSSAWCGALRLLPPCASSALLLLVTVWAYASFAHP